MSPTRIDPYLSGNFRILIDNITVTHFSEALGLEAAVDVVDYRAGDSNENSVIKLAGLRRFSNITLRRGLTSDASLWNWFNNILSGTMDRRSVVVELLDAQDNLVWRWSLLNAWPCRWAGPSLVANSSEVALETVEICCESLTAGPAQ
jgi:phage tail-like protein